MPSYITLQRAGQKWYVKVYLRAAFVAGEKWRAY